MAEQIELWERLGIRERATVPSGFRKLTAADAQRAKTTLELLVRTSAREAFVVVDKEIYINPRLANEHRCRLG